MAAGFEHSVANLYLMPMAMLLQLPGGKLGWAEFFTSLLPVLAGNVIGGALLVGLVYRFIFHPAAQDADGTHG